MRFRQIFALAVLLLLPSLFAACGGDSGGQNDDPTGPSGSNQAPSVSIDQPAADTSLGRSYTSTFEGSASDAEDGDLSGGSLVWESDRDGEIGTGQSVAISGLSRGQHTITLTATDSDGSSSSATVGAAVVDAASADTLLTDPYADSLVVHFTSSKQAAVDSALSDCDAALSDGDVPLLESCLTEARSEVDSTGDPNDRALGAALDLLLAHAERHLRP